MRSALGPGPGEALDTGLWEEGREALGVGALRSAGCLGPRLNLKQGHPGSGGLSPGGCSGEPSAD